MYTQPDVYNSGKVCFHGGGINACYYTLLIFQWCLEAAEKSVVPGSVCPGML